MSNVAFLGTTHGQIVKVVAGAGGSQSIVLASPTTTRPISSLVLTPGTPSHIFADQAFPSGNNMHLFTTVDDGATWATGLFTAGGGSSPSGFYPDGGPLRMARLEDDTLVVIDSFGPTHEWIVHSTDGGVTWPIINTPAVPSETSRDSRWRWYQKGKFWYLSVPSSISNNVELRSVLPNGSDFQNPVIDTFGTNLQLEGTHRDTGTNVMLIAHNPSFATTVSVIDITAPDSPVVTNLATLPDPLAPPFMVPHTDTTWFAVYTSKIYKSTNAGATWTLLLNPGGFPFSGNGGTPAVMTSDANDVFVMGRQSDRTLFYSPDLGATWETISLAGTIGSAQVSTMITPNGTVARIRNAFIQHCGS